MQLIFKNTLKDFQIARMMNWQDINSKNPISKSDLKLVKILREWGIIIYYSKEVSVVGYPYRYTSFCQKGEENELYWVCINSDCLDFPDDISELDNFEKYR